MAIKPSNKRKYVPPEEDLDVTPIMNLIVVLIPALLMTAEWVKLGLIETKLPPRGGGGGDFTEQVEYKNLNLLVMVDQEGFAVSLFNATRDNPEVDGVNYYYEIPRSPEGDYDYSALNERIHEIYVNVVEQGKTGRMVERRDRAGNPILKPDGTPEMVEEYIYRDADKVRISAPNDLNFQKLVNVLDACRIFQSGPNELTYMFPVPYLGKLS